MNLAEEISRRIKDTTIERGKTELRNMRRIDREMGKEDTLNLLQRGKYGVLSTVDDNKQPYGVPLIYVLVGSCIYFHCALEGSKLDNIREHNKVSFAVVGKTEVLTDKFSIDYESAIVFGEAVVIGNEEEKIAVLREMLKKYFPEFMEAGENYITNTLHKTAVVKIKIKSCTGKHRV